VSGVVICGGGVTRVSVMHEMAGGNPAFGVPSRQGGSRFGRPN